MIVFNQDSVIRKIPSRNISVYCGFNESNEKTVLKHYNNLKKSEYKVKKREIKCMKKLEGHPRVVKILEYEETRDYNEEETIYDIKILMEYLGDTNLATFLDHVQLNNLIIEDDWIINEMTELIKLFSLMQQQNICHRDIRPENIMLFENTLKIIDFSEGKTECKGFNPSLMRGTLQYLSPEMRHYEGNYIFDEYKSDVWSLGLVFLKITTFAPLTFNYLDNLQKDVDHYVTQISNDRIRNIINWMLQVRVESRKNFIELNELISNGLV
jgi:serine/threonine protein kinase